MAGFQRASFRFALATAIAVWSLAARAEDRHRRVGSDPDAAADSHSSDARQELSRLVAAAGTASDMPGDAVPGQPRNDPRLRGFASLMDFGARCDGRTDDAPALARALGAGFGRIVVPDARCFLASPVVGPPAASIELDGAAFHPGNPATGSTLLCAPTVSPCLTLGGSNRQVTVRDLVIDRQGGRPDRRTVGLEIRDAYNVIIDDVMSHNHGQCYLFRADGVLGIGMMGTRMYSGACSDAHLVNDSWAEMRIAMSRFGQNGLGDYAAATYVRFQGGYDNTAAGPNTVEFNNTQFNQGSESVAHWLEFHDRARGDRLVQETFGFHQVHVEAVGRGGIETDATWTRLGLVDMTGLSFVQTQVPFLVLDPATEVEDWQIQGADLRVADFTLAPIAQINQFVMTNATVEPGRFTIEAPPHSVVDLHGNNFIGGLTLAGFDQGAVTVMGGDIYGRFVDRVSRRAKVTMVTPDNVIMQGLPTSDAGLPSGSLWRKGGTLGIVP